jgi:hypothetical protein
MYEEIYKYDKNRVEIRYCIDLRLSLGKFGYPN